MEENWGCSQKWKHQDVNNNNYNNNSRHDNKGTTMLMGRLSIEEILVYMWFKKKKSLRIIKMLDWAILHLGSSSRIIINLLGKDLALKCENLEIAKIPNTKEIVICYVHTIAY